MRVLLFETLFFNNSLYAVKNPLQQFIYYMYNSFTIYTVHLLYKRTPVTMTLAQCSCGIFTSTGKNGLTCLLEEYFGVYAKSTLSKSWQRHGWCFL